MRTRLIVGFAALLAMTLVPNAAAQLPTQDRVTGTALLNGGGAGPGGRALVSVDAASGPSGESPTGSVGILLCPEGPCGTQASSLGGDVTCMNVQGNRAVIGTYGTAYPRSGGFFRQRGFLEVIDNGTGPGLDVLNHEDHSVDILGNPSADVPLTTCPSTVTPDFLSGPIPPPPSPSDFFYGQLSGLPQDFTVVDAHPFPTTVDQCKHGGWQQYGFKNQGRCIAFVLTTP
jgi:hypothetical protein